MAFAFVGDTSCPCCYKPGTKSFDKSAAPASLKGMRKLLEQHKLGAYIVPMGDAHTSEYVSEADKRVEWLTGFTGSAGTAVVTADRAMLFTDGRYFTQAAEQLKGTEWILMKLNEPGVPKLEEWAAMHQAQLNGPIGVDATLVSISGAEEWKDKGCAPMSLVPMNLCDEVWGSAKPKRSAAALRMHPAPLAGETVASKLHRVAKDVRAQGCHSLVLGALDQICWLFNMRGADIECTPGFYAYAVVRVGPTAAVSEYVNRLPSSYI